MSSYRKHFNDDENLRRSSRHFLSVKRHKNSGLIFGQTTYFLTYPFFLPVSVHAGGFFVGQNTTEMLSSTIKTTIKRPRPTKIFMSTSSGAFLHPDFYLVARHLFPQYDARQKRQRTIKNVSDSEMSSY